MDNFLYELGSASKVAGFNSVTMKSEAKSNEPSIKSGESKIYDEYSFPLSMDLKFRTGEAYSYQYTDISFNKESLAEKFDIEIPKDAIISKWDLNSKNYSVEQIKKEADFKFKVPAKELPKKLVLNKIIRQEGPVPAFTVIYERRPYFLYITEFKDYGVSLAPTGRGIRLKSGKKGELILGPHSNSYSFSFAGIRFILYGNITLDELLRVADGI